METIKKGSSSTAYVLSHSDLDAYFNVDTSASDAYASCGINSYDLVDSGGATLTDTSKASYAAAASGNTA
jgi:hypothetical protein